MEINLRINQLIEKLGYNKSSFATKITVSQPIITHITNGRNNPGLEVLQKILIYCPEVNPEWLILGTGEMILDNKIQKQISINLITDLIKSIQIVEIELESLKEKTELLKKMVQKS